MRAHWKNVIWSALVVSIGSMSFSLHAMVYDNRFWPLYPQPFFSNQNVVWDYAGRAVFWGSDDAFGSSLGDDLHEDDETPLFQLYGRYDQVKIDAALRKAGIITTSLLRSDMRRVDKIPWNTFGKINAKGAVFESFLHLGSYFGIGGSYVFGKVNSHLQLERSRRESSLSSSLSPGDEQELVLLNQKIDELLHLTAPSYSRFSSGDLDLYARFHVVRDYCHKFRRIDAGVNLGFLIPTASEIPLNNPAALSLGGPKHFGMYGAFDGTFILKEDLTFGLLLRLSQRFSKVACHRMPIADEPINYGAVVGLARVTPGLTIIFSPRIQLDGLRDGLGVNVAYQLVYHKEDEWEPFIKANYRAIERRSSWGSDYMSVSAFYDFGYDKDCAKNAPILSMTVDVPFEGLVTKRVSKTFGVSLRIESRL